MRKRFLDYFYALANFSGGVVSYAVSSFYMFFYVDQLGLDAGYYAIAMIIYGVWNAVNDPIAGYLSDRTKTRWGRRKPYMLFGAIPLGVTFMMVFMPPQFALSSQLMLFIYFVTAMCLYDTFFTITMLNWSAVLPEMYPDEKNRTLVGGISQVFGVVGAVGATLLVQPIVNRFGYTVMAVILGIVGIVTMLLSCIGVQEDPQNSEAEPLGFLDSMKATFSSKAFIVCVSSVLVIETGKLLLTSTMVFYSLYVFGNDLGVTLLMGAMFISSIIFTPIIVKMSDKYGAKKIYMLSALIYAAGSLGFFAAPSMNVAVAVALILGFATSGTMIIENVLYAQIIDEDEKKTGVRREGAYFGVNALIMRLSIIFQGLISTAVFKSTGYVADAAVQVESALFGFRLLMGLIPAVLFVVSFLIITKYPLSGAKE